MKKLLITFIISVVGLIGFGSCDYIWGISDGWGFSQSYSQNTFGVTYTSTVNFTKGSCIKFRNDSCQNDSLFYNTSGSLVSYTNNGYSYVYCFDFDGYYLNNSVNRKCSINLWDSVFGSSCPSCSNYTSEECQSEYSLMPISSCDSEYCELNNLCQIIGGSGSSTLYINDIRHEAAPFIYVNIPDEFKWDYSTGINEFTIDIEGLNGDSDYIQGIIDVNSYRPSSEDFTQIFVGGLTLIFPYIIITAIIIFIRRFIKKLFS